MARCDTHCPEPAGSGIPGPGRVLVALVVAGYRFGRWALPHIALGLAVGSVLAWRWHTGAIMRRTWRGRPRWRRHVRATLRCALTAVALAGLTAPAATAAILAALAAAGSVAALVARDRRRRPASAALPPRRVRVKVGPPRPARRSTPVYVITTAPAATSATWQSTRAGAR